MCFDPLAASIMRLSDGKKVHKRCKLQDQAAGSPLRFRRYEEPQSKSFPMGQGALYERCDDAILLLKGAMRLALESQPNSLRRLLKGLSLSRGNAFLQA